MLNLFSPLRSLKAHFFLVALLTAMAFFLQPNDIRGEAGSGAENIAPTFPVGQSDRPEPAVAMLHKRPVVLFRSRLFGKDPATRAKELEERLERTLSKDKIGEVTTKPIAEGMLFSIGTDPTFVITDEEMHPAFGETPEEVLDRAKRNLNLAIEEVKEGRDPKVMIRAAAFSIVATILLLLILYFVNRLRNRVNRSVVEFEKRLITRTLAKGVFLMESLFSFSRWLINLFISLIALGMIYTWLTLCLRLFPQTRPWGDHLGEYLAGILVGFGERVLGTLPNLAVIALIILFGRLLTSILKALFKAIEERRISFPWLDPEVARPTYRILTAVIWLFALIMAYPYMPGSGSAAFKGVSVFAGLIVTLGSTSFVNQAASGLVLMYSRAFRASDYIRVGETEGTVLHLGILSTRIKTPKGEEVTIPNAVMVSNTTRNFTRLAGGKGALLVTGVTIGYSTPWRKVHELLLMAAKAIDGLASDPAPFVRQKALSDFYVEYELAAVVEDPSRRSAVLSELHGSIQDTFNRFEEQIMSPHYVADPSEKMIVPEQNWFFSAPTE